MQECERKCTEMYLAIEYEVCFIFSFNLDLLLLIC